MGLINVDVDLLRTLVVVSEMKNFTAAGEKLHRTQSAISLQIKRLEGIVGETIFDRGSGKEIRLTKYGEMIKSYANEILRLNDALIQEIQTSSAVTALRIGMPDDYAQLLLPRVINEFSKRNEMTEMQIVTDLSTTLSKMIDQGDLDIAFVTRHEGIDGMKLLDERLSWVTVPDSRVALDTPLPLALFPEGCGVRRNAIEALNAIGKRWHIAYCSNNFSSLKTAILERQAIGVLPDRAVPQDLIRIGPEYGLPNLHSSELLVKVNQQASASIVRLATFLSHAFQVGVSTPPAPQDDTATTGTADRPD
ncbi:LysR substrate-binding domain-containing protein [Stappia indica]|uniref:LysR substrate-binding domain-containing protein n=1 Tax=Stappia indica TaxID=538381 RepID=UPI001CD25D85|nr:LysR family transcriptional regulator [Stappia indica]MCA1298742.1 LysR family transcriptional regulator [Stappia indica]